MDEFEQKLIKIILDAVANLNIDKNYLAKYRLKRYSAMFYKLLVEGGEQFDLIIAAGDSGVIALEITKIIYKVLNLKVPKTILLPVVRFVGSEKDNKRFDNRYLKDYVSSNLTNKYKNILFVDDEIRAGWTLKVCLESAIDYFDNQTTCTIIAENHFFEWHYKIANVSVRLFSHSKAMYGINKVFRYLLPVDFFEEILKVESEVENENCALAVVLGGKNKVVLGGKAEFSDSISKKLDKYVERYESKVNTLRLEIEMLCREGVDMFKKNEIVFKY